MIPILQKLRYLKNQVIWSNTLLWDMFMPIFKLLQGVPKRTWIFGTARSQSKNEILDTNWEFLLIWVWQYLLYLMAFHFFDVYWKTGYKKNYANFAIFMKLSHILRWKMLQTLISVVHFDLIAITVLQFHEKM